MTAPEIYDCIREYGNFIETTICHLHQPNKIPCCSDPSCKCKNTSQIKVLNFDQVKSCYCSRKGISPYSSTDALTYKNNYVLFIEIKGWRRYITIRRIQHRKIYKEEIVNQEQKYNLNKKLEDSIVVCKNIIAPNNFVSDKDIVYIHVIDTDSTLYDPRLQLVQNLNVLAYDSSKIYLTINNITDTHMQDTIERPIRKIRVFCQHFDDSVTNLI